MRLQAGKIPLSILRAGLLVLGFVLLAGCVTDSTNRRVNPDSDKNALEDRIQLGLSYISQGNRDAARHHLLKALEMDSRSPGALHGMALLYQMEQEYDLAEQHFKKALSLDKGFTRARNNYGVFLFQQGRYEDALREFEIAGADTDYELRPQVFFSLGVTADKLGKSDVALDAYDKALALNPRMAAVYLELTDHYFQAQQLPKAKQALDAYDSLARPTARSLWLSVRIEDYFGNRDARASKGLALKKLFPYSKENLEYQEWLKNERKR